MVTIPNATPYRAAFTLIELLVVILILGVIAAILFPALGGVSDSAKTARCTSNLRQLYNGAILYANSEGGELLPSLNRSRSGDAEQWPELLLNYVRFPNENELKKELSCPLYEGNSNDSFWSLGYAYNETPAYLGDSSGLNNKQSKRQLHRIKKDGSGPRYRLTEITYSASRLMFCDSDSWHINPKVTEDHADLSRHGENRCNGVFYDGHIDMLTPEQIHLAIADPMLYRESKETH